MAEYADSVNRYYSRSDLADKILAALQDAGRDIDRFTQDGLSSFSGMSDRATFRHGNALHLPLDDESLDSVWTQSVLMNTKDKRRAFGEMRRVLRPSGRLAFSALMAAPVPNMHFPVIWASGPDLAFLLPPEEMR